MSLTGLRTFLASHTDDPKGARHHLYAMVGDDGLHRICCFECKPRQFLVRDTAEQTTWGPAHVRAEDRCGEHIGQRKGFCGPCRADSLVDGPPEAPQMCELDEVPVAICGGPHHWVKSPAGFDAVAYADGTLVSERQLE
jgi:hypothetical protein